MITYADSGLKTDLGHHANSARAIVPHLGPDVKVLGQRQMGDRLAEELGADRAFSWFAWDRANADPVAGWLWDFNNIGDCTGGELIHAVKGIKQPRVYWNSANPPQFLAVLKLLTARPEAKAVVEFGVSPGLDTSIDSNGKLSAAYRDPRADPTGLLWRYSSFFLENFKERLTLATFCKRASELFSELLAFPVATFPVPRDAHANPRLRGAKPDVTIGVLGHQRVGDKGWQHVPWIVRRVLERSRGLDRTVRFLLHNGDAGGSNTGQWDRMARQLCQEYPTQVEFDTRLATPVIWQELLDRTDLMLCPYWPERFHASYSAVAAEAIANGIPLICPAQTSLMDACSEVRAIPICFALWAADEIADVTFQAVRCLDELTVPALEATHVWRERHGGAKTAERIKEALA